MIKTTGYQVEFLYRHMGEEEWELEDIEEFLTLEAAKAAIRHDSEFYANVTGPLGGKWEFGYHILKLDYTDMGTGDADWAQKLEDK